MQDLSDVQAGDQVIQCGRNSSLHTVTRTTPTQIVIGRMKFQKKTGWAVGRGSSSIRLPKPGEVEKLQGEARERNRKAEDERKKLDHFESRRIDGWLSNAIRIAQETSNDTVYGHAYEMRYQLREAWAQLRVAKKEALDEAKQIDRLMETGGEQFMVSNPRTPKQAHDAYVALIKNIKPQISIIAMALGVERIDLCPWGLLPTADEMLALHDLQQGKEIDEQDLVALQDKGLAGGQFHRDAGKISKTGEIVLARNLTQTFEQEELHRQLSTAGE